jgi:hypothetical protein
MAPLSCSSSPWPPVSTGILPSGCRFRCSSLFKNLRFAGPQFNHLSHAQTVSSVVQARVAVRCGAPLPELHLLHCDRHVAELLRCQQAQRWCAITAIRACAGMCQVCRIVLIGNTPPGAAKPPSLSEWGRSDTASAAVPPPTSPAYPNSGMRVICSRSAH